jgi:hypothetical protein
MGRYHLSQMLTDIDKVMIEDWAIIDTLTDTTFFIGPYDEAYERVGEYNRAWKAGEE